jgi:phage host-nuclease inhibitor protein Gam
MYEELTDALAEKARLRAEIERLKTERANEARVYHETQWRQLKEAHAEIERLRKELADAIAWHEAERGNEPGESPRIDGWRATLEPKP